jgi:hypothetical protein
MTESAAAPARLPRGLVRDGDRLTLSYGVAMHVLVGIAVLLPVAIAVAMAVLVPQDEPDAPIVAGMLAIGAVPLALWWFLVRGVQYVIDGEGLTKTRWRRATVRWEAVADIRPWGRQIVVRAPGAVDFGGRRPGSELRLAAAYLAVPGPELLRFLRQYWAARHAVPSGPLPPRPG